MAGTVTETLIDHASVKELRWDWISGTGGDVGKADATSEKVLNGRIALVLAVPDTTAKPTDLYDLRILDPDGVDILEGGGANLPGGANIANVVISPISTKKIDFQICNQKLVLEITNAGDTKEGAVIKRYR